ncbi:MAG: hypothetical protein K0R03_2700 [Moraxellaceae bacterium]|jgi:hypothetical protein|nr:hypothetical protein [Moraxellaceae bacterium]
MLKKAGGGPRASSRSRSTGGEPGRAALRRYFTSYA